MSKVNNAKLEKIAITKKNIAYKYLNDCVIFSLKISGKQLFFIILNICVLMKNKILKYDFLVVGGGLIGALAAFALHKKNYKIFDEKNI